MVSYLAELGKLAFSPEELEQMAKDMTSIIAIMDTVKEIDITYDAVADNKNVYLNDLREDFSVPSFPTEKILQKAVNDEYCFVVPKVVGKEIHFLLSEKAIWILQQWAFVNSGICWIVTKFL